jgi:hypothetical protein
MTGKVSGIWVTLPSRAVLAEAFCSSRSFDFFLSIAFFSFHVQYPIFDKQNCSQAVPGLGS